MCVSNWFFIGLYNNARVAVLCFAVMFFVACSTTEQTPFDGRIVRGDDREQYKVEVYTNGRKLERVESELVHRVELSHSDVDFITANNSSSVPFGVRAVKEKDAKGEQVGFRVTALPQKGAIYDLGLKVGDIVTAIGQKTSPKSSDLTTLFPTLKNKGSASLTVMRSGVNHKILYYLK